MSPYWLIAIAPLAVVGLYALGMWAYRYWLGTPPAPEPGPTYAALDALPLTSFEMGAFSLPAQASTTQRFRRRGFCDECDAPVACRQYDGRSLCATHKRN